jgi:ATP-dependent exoDNAse (exonuclease V) alpha subunit
MSTSITVPDAMHCRSENLLIQSVYNSMTDHSHVPPPDYFHDRAILAARNDDVRSLNSTILDHLTGDERMYCSADSYSIESPTEHENNNIPIEFLNSLNASGLPIAHLRLKIGRPIIILRNIDSKRGLCNGTRGTILQMTNRLLEIQLITEDHAGETALIPRITLSPSLTGLDFAIKLNRCQFPIQLVFTMTINKAQGQTLKHIGIDLRNPVFAHGQLYVAFSRATSSEHIKVLLDNESQGKKTHNVVYNEVLLD